MSKIPARLYRDLTDDEKREIELEENVRRKDLTPYERSKNIVALYETAAEVIRNDSLPPFGNESPRKRGGQPKADSEQKVAARIGIPQQTINDAKQHVAAVTSYPELAAPGIPRHADYALQPPPFNATSRRTSRKRTGQGDCFSKLSDEPQGKYTRNTRIR